MDEIGNMSLTMQVKLYRVLQEGKVRPIGSTEEIDVMCRDRRNDNRIRKKLRGGFRNLYYRSADPVHCPLRKRRGVDIFFFFFFSAGFSPQPGHFLSVSAREHGKNDHGMFRRSDWLNCEAYIWPATFSEWKIR